MQRFSKTPLSKTPLSKTLINTLPKLLGVGVSLAIVLPAGLLGWAYWRVSTPARNAVRLALPEPLISVESGVSQTLLASALAADHPALEQMFQVQAKGSWCGVASAVTVLNARGENLTQQSFFTPDVTDVRPWLATTFGGMPLGDLAQMLDAHGAAASVEYAAGTTLAAFRASLKENANNPEDWLIVNYDRRVLKQQGGGHISPISAYSEEKDMVLLLDTAGYKYPFHWIPVSLLFEAMNTPDSESGQSRGWVVIR